MGVIQVLNEKGDERIEWNPDDAEQVKAAKTEFKRLKDDGYNFYEIEERQGKKVERFDKKLGKLIAAPGGRTEKDKAAGTRPHAMSGGPLSARAASAW